MAEGIVTMEQASPPTRRMVGSVKNANHVRVVTIGWLLGLLLAAMFLPVGDLGLRPASGVIKGVLAVLAVWVTYTAVAVPVYFYHAWRRVRAMPNKTEYALWLVFETLCAVALIGGIIYSVVPHR